ncbi:MAG TPA: glycosyltransferase family 39 protein, partial [Methylomirabilota bacterium]|nr:glycosyltransferase family 39 protein [Methylomirabilota bacterium]
MTNVRRHTALVAVLGLYVVLSFAYAWRIPIMEGADELGHALYIDHVVRTRSLPEIGSDWEAVQPPLYYFVAGVVVAVAGSPRLVPETLRENPEFDWADPVVASVFDRTSYLPADARPSRRLRLLSSVFGFGTLILIYATALSAGGGRRRLALGATALPALTPQFVHHHAVISNDSLATLLSALLTYQLVAALSGSGSTIAVPKAMGFIAGLGVLTKYTVLPVAAAVFFGLMLFPGPARDRLRRASTFAIVTLATCGAWLTWNTVRYGDPLAQAAMRRAHAALAVDASIADLVFDPSFLARVFKSYWGMLGSMVVPLHDSVYVAFCILTVAGVIGALLAFKQRTVQRHSIV